MTQNRNLFSNERPFKATLSPFETKRNFDVTFNTCSITINALDSKSTQRASIIFSLALIGPAPCVLLTSVN